MPSRRSVLGVCGLLGASALAGCADLRDLSDYARGPPAYTDWLYDPVERFGATRVGYASLDVSRFLAARERLSDSLTDGLDRLERTVPSVDLSDVTRLTAVGFGSLDDGRAGLTLAAEGSFAPDAIRESYRVRRDDEWTHLGVAHGHDRWAYSDSFLNDLEAYRGPEQERAPSATAGVALSETSVVVGVALDTDLRGSATMDAALTTRFDEGTRYVETHRTARDVTDALESEPFVLGVSEAVVGDLTADLPEDRALLRDVLSGVRAAGIGTHTDDAAGDGEAGTALALVYDPGEVVSLDTVRSLVERLSEDGGPTETPTRDVDVGVELAQSGRVILVRAGVGPIELLGGLERADSE